MATTLLYPLIYHAPKIMPKNTTTAITGIIFFIIDLSNYLIYYHRPEAPPPPKEPPPPPPKLPKPPNPPIPLKPDPLGPPKIIGGPPHQYHEERLLPNRKLNKNGNNKSRYNSENNGFWVPADFFLNSFISGIPVISAPLYAAILCITTTAA